MNDTVVLDPSVYTIHNLNIISSTKINQKVTQILRIFGVLPPVSSAQKETTEDEPKPAHDASVFEKTCTIVIIRAKANVASKLISIVEILKRDLARRATERHETEKATDEDKTAAPDTRQRKVPIQRIYQYTSVTTIPAEVKMKPPQPKPAQPPSMTPPTSEDQQQQGTKRKRPVDSSQDSTTTTAIAAARTSKKQKSDIAHAEQDEQPGTTAPAEDEDEDFEMMATPTVAASGKDTGAQPAAAAAAADAPKTQMRDIPLLTVYLCSKPVDVLEKAFGEQGSRVAEAGLNRPSLTVEDAICKERSGLEV